MANLYIMKMKETNFEFNIDNVAGLWKKQVLDKLALEGLDGYGNPLPTEA